MQPQRAPQPGTATQKGLAAPKTHFPARTCDTGGVDWVQPEWIWGAVTRVIGAVYLISFTSLSRQILAVAGSRGVTPVALKLAAARRDFTAPRRFLYFPTLLWLDSSDRTLRALPLLGVAAAVCVLVGGPLSFPGLLACYVLYLSLDVAARLTFPWECVLFEAGFIALFLPATLPLPDIAAVAAPDPLLCWAYRLLLFRVLMGFGKFKFIGSTRQDRDFLRGFLINQPLPSPLAPPAARLPVWMMQAGLWALFLVEIIFPFGVFWPGVPSLVAAVGFVGLMGVIQLSGNFGFFNLLVAGLSLCLLDNRTPTTLVPAALLDPGAIGVLQVVLSLHAVGGLLHFPMNQYFSQSWLHWTTTMRVLPAPLQWPLAFYRGLHGLRWVQAYGVFPPKAMAAVRNVACVEASWDGAHWQELEPIIAPTTERSPPCVVAPHHARYAQALIYESYGTTDYGLAYSVAGTGVPYYHALRSEAQCLMQRVLEGERYEGVIFRRGTFGDHAGPPRRVRMRTFAMVPTTGDAHRGGRYWTRRYVGPHQPETELDPDFWQDWLPSPVLWDWDSLVWRRRSRLAPWLQRAAGGESTGVLCAGDGVTVADVATFFETLLPLTARPEGSAFDLGLSQAVARMRAELSPAAIRAQRKVLGRLTLALAASLEPAFFAGEGAIGTLPTYLHLRMLCHRILGDGRDAYERARAEPGFAAGYVEGLELEGGLWLYGLFDYRRLVAEAQKIRLLDSVLVRASERWPDSDKARYEAGVDALAKRVWGAAHLTPWLRTIFRGEPFEADQPERYPLFELGDDGRIVPVDPGLWSSADEDPVRPG